MQSEREQTLVINVASDIMATNSPSPRARGYALRLGLFTAIISSTHFITILLKSIGNHMGLLIIRHLANNYS